MSDALLLILDAVPYAMMRTLHQRGLLEGFGAPRPMVAPFPSLTNVGVPALVRPIFDGRPPSYEPRWFHPPTGEVRGGVTTPEAAKALDSFDGAPRTTAGQMAVYVASSHIAYLEARWYTRSFSEDGGAYLGWVNATDGVGHFEGEQAMLLAVADIVANVQRVVRDWTRERGTHPAVVLCSDHGMEFSSLRHLGAPELDAALREAGVGETVLVPHGDVGVGVVHCEPGRAADAADVVAALEGVDLAVARTGPAEAQVRAPRGCATVAWESGRTRTEGDDVLELGELRGRWIADRQLLELTWGHTYPWAPARIRDAVTETHVRWPAPVLFSMDRGWTCGPRLTHVAARLRGGQLATHGGLRRQQTLGFAVCNRDDVWPEGPLASGDVLAPWADLLRP